MDQLALKLAYKFHDAPDKVAKFTETRTLV